jgi:transcriptional regulator with XRE-family HTH domain
MNAARNNELGEFLRTRRARVRPGEVGLSEEEKRRVPGLRREELAQLAGVSPDYYTRLEQGRQPTASSSVLDAVARALLLTPDEQSYLYTLARVGDLETAGTERSGHVVGPGATRVLNVLGDTPAFVCGRYVDVIFANVAACFLFADFNLMPVSDRNILRWTVLSPQARELYGDDWERTVGEMTGMLRLDAGRYPSGSRLSDITGELLEKSPLFGRLWKERMVSTRLHFTKTLHHRSLGPMEFFSEAITIHSTPDQAMYVVIPGDPRAFGAAFRNFAEETGRPARGPARPHGPHT